MKVTKAQAQANRARVVETATTLFRERGYDGVGVADLMAAAGLTHGGFYKNFGSKADLMAEAAACGLARSADLSNGVDVSVFVQHYLSRKHRDARASGCTIAALSGDAARQPETVRAAFAAGIENLLTALSPANTSSDAHEAAKENKASERAALRGQHLAMLAQAVGAIVISRACPDNDPLADEILEACRDRILASLDPTPSKRKKSKSAGA